jgi:hypothetical protein
MKKGKKKKDADSVLRVHLDETEDIGLVTHYKGKPFTGIYYDLHENGELSAEYEMLNGLKHGCGIMFDDKGQLKYEANYKDDILIEGWFKIWKDGKLIEERGIIEEGNPITPKPNGLIKVYIFDDDGDYLLNNDGTKKIKMIDTNATTEVNPELEVSQNEQILPEWFDGELYEEGGYMVNSFTNEKYELNNVEMSMYDFIIGSSSLIEMGKVDARNTGSFMMALVWFKENNNAAYKVLIKYFPHLLKIYRMLLKEMKKIDNQIPFAEL